ncbi:MAG: hypothetical protein KC900_14290 [Candidatus Omnitrophica bacterium]|nr:hypothetical protein [Candidatus Omnitrophota bacterium]
MDKKILIEKYFQIVVDKFSQYMESNDFLLETREIQNNSAQVVFRSGSRYVKLLMNLDERDGPNYFNIVLGEGLSTYPEADWNSIALWKLMESHSHDNVGEYAIRLTDVKDVEKVIDLGLQDLEGYGNEFMCGKISTFRKVRGKLNRDREPYIIHKFDKDKGRVSVVDPESERLRKKFS